MEELVVLFITLLVLLIIISTFGGSVTVPQTPAARLYPTPAARTEPFIHAFPTTFGASASVKLPVPPLVGMPPGVVPPARVESYGDDVDDEEDEDVGDLQDDDASVSSGSSSSSSSSGGYDGDDGYYGDMSNM